GRAFALHHERIGFRQLFVLELQFADVTSFDARKSEPEVRVVSVLTGAHQLFATLDASLQHRRVGDGGIDFGAWGLDAMRGRKFHRTGQRRCSAQVRLKANSNARRVLTCARCARNSAEASLSPSGSTPSAALAAAVAT